MFPSMRASRLLALLVREPLAYRVVRQRGSHRRLVSDLSEASALRMVKGRDR
jgi:predicted RNA binding protein YcfA (HicA-like mRNA interferase family)